MSVAAQVLYRTALRLISLQLVFTFLVAMGYLFQSGNVGFQSALFGGLIAVVGTWISARGIKKAGSVKNKEEGYKAIYSGAMLKFSLTLLLMALGLGVLNLSPIALLMAFAVAQIAFLFNQVDTKLSIKE